jgi:iron complex transport system substrate-binding protein
MRIVSLLPSTTEILFALGAGDDVVGVTFECDTPAEARTRTIVSTSALPPGLSPADIDSFVARAVADGKDLYHLDAGALSALEADLVVTQDLCAVCAVDVSVVDDALDFLGCDADVATIDPSTVAEVLGSILTLGERTGRRDAAVALVADLQQRLAAVEVDVTHLPRPRVLILEWTDPPYAPGHWLPEMITLAGGEPAMGRAGARSHRITWDDVAAARPDVVVCAPCGFDLPRAAELGRATLEHLPDVPVWAVDANAAFTRPGPRLVDGVETLATVLHSGDGPSPDTALRLR